MQKLTRSLFALGAVMGLAACGDDVTVTPPTPPPAATVTGVVVSPAATTIKVGESVVFSAALQTTGTVSNTAVTWSSANAAIASVDGTGKVTGAGAGTTTIRATSAANTSASGAGAVTVVAPAVQSVSVTPASVSMAVGQSLTAVATVARDAGVAGTVSWSSSALGVATVSTAGVVAAVGAGTATITAVSTADPTKSAAMTVNVGANLTGLSVSPASASMTVGQSLTVVPTATTIGSPTVTYTYATSSQSIASVTTAGVVTAAAVGTAVITTTASTGSATLTATTTVTVSPIPNNLISLTVSPSSVNLLPAATQQLTPTANTVGSPAVTYGYATSAPAVATVSPTGMVTGVATGTATITVMATTSTNSLSASVTVTVSPIPNNLTSLTVSPSSVTILTNGSQQLTPTAATVGSPAVAYSYATSAPAIATVSPTGLVSGVTVGTATITVTATTSTNSLSAAVTVTVAPIPNNLLSLSVSPSTVNMGPQATQQLTPTVNTVGTPTVTYAYATSNAAVATVTAGGLVSGVATGTATITVTASTSTNSLNTAVTVTIANNLLGLSVAPTTINIGPQGTQQITAVASTVGSPTVTYGYVSNNTSVATVDGSGLVTGVASGSAVITVTATTSTNSVSATVTVNVVAASVSIQSLTTCIGGPPCTVIPVNLAGVTGQIEATLTLSSGSQSIDSVTVSIGSVQAASQVFGVNGAPNAAVTLSMNTAGFNATTYAPYWINGPQTLVAKIYPHGATSPTASNTVQFTLINNDVVYFDAAGLVHTGNSASDLGSNIWWKGGFTYQSHPVNYSGMIQSITYNSSACGSNSGTVAPSFQATFSCGGVESSQSIGSAITVSYPATYTLSPAPTAFMTALSVGFVPGSPVYAAISTNEDNVGPATQAVTVSNPGVGGWHGSQTTYSAIALDGGVSAGINLPTEVHWSTNGFLTDGGSLTGAAQLAPTLVPANYSVRGHNLTAIDALGNVGAAAGPAFGVFGVDLQVTDAQYANRTNSALAGVFPLASNGTIYTGAAWTAQEALADLVAVDAIDLNGSGLDNPNALTQAHYRNGPGVGMPCLSGTFPMNTVLLDNYVQGNSAGANQIDCGLAAASRTGRYTWTASVKDRAGNSLKPFQGSVSATTPLDSVYILIDEAIPAITGIGFQTTLYTGGAAASFSFSANDNYEIKDGQVSLTYGALTPTVTYPYGSSAYTSAAFSASPWDATYVNVLNGQVLTLGYLLGNIDQVAAGGVVAGFTSSGIINNVTANVRDWANQTAAAPLSAVILSTQVGATGSVTWNNSSMGTFQILAKTASSITIQQMGASSTSTAQCSRIDIYQADAAAVAGPISGAVDLAYRTTASFTLSAVPFTDNGINRFFSYVIPITTSAPLYSAVCVSGGRGLFSELF